MPLYEYECRKCSRRTERIEKFAGPHLKRCPHCGGAVERLLAAPAVQFKGSGWYVTDYAGKGAGERAEKPAAEATPPSADAKPADSTAKEKGKDGEKKPAKKK